MRLNEYRSRTYLSALGILLVVGTLVAFAVFNSYFSVRFEDAEEALDSLTQRVLIQQAELWWLTYERALEWGLRDFGEAMEFLFTDPLDPTRNTSIQYLMYLALDEEAVRIMSTGQTYAGGIEIFHELFGGAGGVAALAVATLIPAIVMRILIVSLARGQVLTVFWAALVLYPFQIMYWGGMLNFVVAPTFWVKVTGLLLALLVDRDQLPQNRALCSRSW